MNVLVLDKVPGEFEAGADIIGRQIRKIIGDDISKGLSVGSQIQDLNNLYSCSLDARFTVANVGPDRDSRHHFILTLRDGCRPAT